MGKVALVTGGGRGIGRAVALALAQAGARVVITGRARDPLEAVAAEFGGLGLPAPVILEMDVADPDSIATGLEGIAGALAGIDILVNNAGIAESAPLARTDLLLWTRHLAVNATGPFLLSRALLPHMLGRRWGRIVNIASMAALGGAPYIAAYAASKHALLGLTRAVAAMAGFNASGKLIEPAAVAATVLDLTADAAAGRTGEAVVIA